jgi:hypothetical protein
MEQIEDRMAMPEQSIFPRVSRKLTARKHQQHKGNMVDPWREVLVVPAACLEGPGGWAVIIPNEMAARW